MHRTTRRWFLLSFILPVFLLFFSGAPATWGFFGHKKINELAIYTLPEEMFGFYKHHMDFLVEHAVDPDKRRYGVKGEAECHYIDMDRYCFDTVGCNPFHNIPRRWTDAVEMYGEDSLRANGIVPWHVYTMTQRLTQAMKDEDVNRILRFSAEIGHYISDAHVPLHTTSNYNGQQTDQRGIHGFWESRIPELFISDYDFFVGKARYIRAPLYYIWDRVEESYAAVDSVLGFEASLTSSFPSDRKYSYETRGQVYTKVYSREFSEAYQAMLDGQVERRMRSAIIAVGSYWYTAWVDAGQPDLDRLLPQAMTDEDLLKIQEELALPGDPALKVREHDNQ